MSTQWQIVKEIFSDAKKCGGDERRALLDQACGTDNVLRREVESLLSAFDNSDNFLGKPAIGDFGDGVLAQKARLENGVRLNHYLIISHLGAGGMGEVYLAEDEKLDRKVALKILNQEFSREKANLQRFIREAKAASALNHPNILVIYEIGESGDWHYIVSEYIEGKTLREVLREKSLNLPEILDIGIQTAKALAAAHEARLAHRDIKPENLMVRPDGVVKVLDFGLAKLIERKNKSILGSGHATVGENGTAQGVILGTVNYMSPEQAKGEPVDERTDIFSFGALVYELIAGKTPFAGETVSESFANLINAEPHPLVRSTAIVPDELQKIVFKLLRKNRNERYQSMKDVLADLTDFRENLLLEEKSERSAELEIGSPTAILQQSTGSTNLPTDETRHSFSKHIEQPKPFAAFALVALLAGAIGLGFYFFYAGKTASRADGKKSIAVLPLKPINAGVRDEFYEIGIADSLIHKLSSTKGFIIRPLSAIRKYADIEQDPLAAGREQQVDYVLASNYQLTGGKIKITAQLFNVANGQIEETYQIEKEAGNIFAVQDAIAGNVANLVLERLGGASNNQTAKRGTTNEEAYRLYLQGMYLYDKRNLENARKAIEKFEHAVKLDPNYAPAWAGKAHAHRSVANFGRNTNINEEYQKSIEAINKALALDENLSEAYSALCENKMYYEYDFAGAERECRRAIELDPNSPLAREVYARYLSSRGRSDEAITEVKAAIDLEPTSLFNQRNYGLALYYARRYEEAVAQFKRVIEMDQNFGSTYGWLTNTLQLQGNQSEAFEWHMKSPASRKADEETVQALKTAYQTSGWQGILRERVKKFEESNEHYFFGAAHNAQLGNKDKAFEYLEKSFKRREWGMAYLQVDPRFDSLSDDPRFDDLVKRIGSK